MFVDCLQKEWKAVERDNIQILRFASQPAGHVQHICDGLVAFLADQFGVALALHCEINEQPPNRRGGRQNPVGRGRRGWWSFFWRKWNYSHHPHHRKKCPFFSSFSQDLKSPLLPRIGRLKGSKLEFQNWNLTPPIFPGGKKKLSQKTQKCRTESVDKPLQRAFGVFASIDLCQIRLCLADRECYMDDLIGIHFGQHQCWNLFRNSNIILLAWRALKWRIKYFVGAKYFVWKWGNYTELIKLSFARFWSHVNYVKWGQDHVW